MDLDRATRRADTVLSAAIEIADDSLALYEWYQARTLLALLLATQDVHSASYTQLCAWVAQRDLSRVHATARGAPADVRFHRSLAAFQEQSPDELAPVWRLLSAVLQLSDVIQPDR
jgi:hypothetical protein